MTQLTNPQPGQIVRFSDRYGSHGDFNPGDVVTVEKATKFATTLVEDRDDWNWNLGWFDVVTADDVKALEAEIAAVRDGRDAAIGRADRNLARLLTIQRDATALQRKVEDAEARVRVLETERDAAQAEVRAARPRILALEAELEEAKRQIAKLAAKPEPEPRDSYTLIDGTGDFWFLNESGSWICVPASYLAHDDKLRRAVTKGENERGAHQDLEGALKIIKSYGTRY